MKYSKQLFLWFAAITLVCAAGQLSTAVAAPNTTELEEAQGSDSAASSSQGSDGQASDSQTSGTDQPRGLPTARDAYASYLDWMGSHRVDLVVSSGLFDALSEQSDRRAVYAGELYEILLRTDAPDPDDVSLGGSGRDSLRIQIRDADGTPLESLWVTRTNEDRWAFDARNASWIPRVYQEYANAPLRADALAKMGTIDRLHRQLRASLPESALARAFVLENWQWVALVVVLGLAVVLGRFVQMLLAGIARRGAGREGLLKSASELKRFNRPAGLFAAASFFGAFLPLAGLEGQILAALAFCARFVGTFAGLWAAYRAVDLICGILEERARLSQNRFDDILIPLLRTTLHIFVVVIGIVYLAAEWTDQLWSIVAGLSIGSLAVGFAARDSIENLFGTFTVLVDKPFALGDWIVVDGIEGTVESVGFRSTRIRTFWDSMKSVPNRQFISGVVENYGDRRKRRIKSTLRLPLDTPAETVDAFCEGVRQLIKHQPESVPSNFVYLYDLGEDALEVLLYTFIETPDWDAEMAAKHRLLADILRLGDSLGVRLAAPARTFEVDRSERPTPIDVGGDAASAGRSAADAIHARPDDD